MKKISVLLCLIVTCLVLSGCSNSRSTESARIITACSATKSSDTTEYTFLVADTSSASVSEDGNSKKTNNTYKFTAPDFSSAVSLFEASCGKADLAHLSVFLADIGYLTDNYASDSSHIRVEMKISPLTKLFVTSSPAEEIFDSLSQNYSTGAQGFVNTLSSQNTKNLLCTMSEIFFAVENPIFTASVPVIEISAQSTLPVINAAFLYNTSTGSAALIGEDYNSYCMYVKPFGKTSKKLILSVILGKLEVSFDADVSNREQIKDFALKYKTMGFDVLNAFYYAKKCFPTYSAYLDFIGQCTINNIDYV